MWETGVHTIKKNLIIIYQNKTGILARQKAQVITWDDIPDSEEVKRKLANAAKLAIIWIGTIIPDIDHAREQRKIRQYLNYALRFFNNVNELEDDQEKQQIHTIKKWSESYLIWLAKTHYYVGDEQIELFHTAAFLGQDPFSDPQKRRNNPEEYLRRDLSTNSKGERVMNFVIGSPEIRVNKIINDLDERNITEPNKKTLGLAKALYKAIDKIKN